MFNRNSKLSWINLGLLSAFLPSLIHAVDYKMTESQREARGAEARAGYVRSPSSSIPKETPKLFKLLYDSGMQVKLNMRDHITLKEMTEETSQFIDGLKGLASPVLREALQNSIETVAAYINSFTKKLEYYDRVMGMDGDIRHGVPQKMIETEQVIRNLQAISQIFKHKLDSVRV